MRPGDRTGATRLPSASPDGLRAAAARLDTIVRTGLSSAAVNGASLTSLGIAWRGPAADQASRDLTTLAARATTTLTHLHEGAARLRSYADAVEVATAELRQVAKARAAARGQHQRDLADIRARTTDPTLAQHAEAAAADTLQRALTLTERRAGAILDSLTAAGTTCARALHDLTAASFPRTRTDDAAAIRAAVVNGLPTVRTMLDSATAAERAAAVLHASGGPATPTNPSPETVMSLAEEYRDLADDPVFAAVLLEKLGPEWMLRASYGLADYSDSHRATGQPATREVETQRFLAALLATAADTTAQAHVTRGWVDRLKTEGRRDFGMGYVALGNLLRTRSYPTAFLVEIGRDMIATDRNLGAAHWATRPVGAMDPAGSSWGRDPIAGLMSAVSHDASAAKLLLDPSDTQGRLAHDSTLDYLLTDREWPAEPAGQPEGITHLARAIHAATTAQPRDNTAAAIMTGTIRVLRDDDAAVDTRQDDIQPSVRPILAEALAGYMADVSVALERHRTDLELATSVDGAPTVALLRRTEAMWAIQSLAIDPMAYASLLTAELRHASAALEESAGNQRRLQGASASSAMVLDLLTTARTSAMTDDFKTADAEFNKSLQARVDMATDVAGLATGQVKSPLLGLIVDNIIQKTADKYVADHSQDSDELAKRLAADLRECDLGSLQTLIESTVWARMTHSNEVQRKYEALFDHAGRPRPLYEILGDGGASSEWDAYRGHDEYVDNIKPVVDVVSERLVK